MITVVSFLDRPLSRFSNQFFRKNTKFADRFIIFKGSNYNGASLPQELKERHGLDFLEIKIEDDLTELKSSNKNYIIEIELNKDYHLMIRKANDCHNWIQSIIPPTQNNILVYADVDEIIVGKKIKQRIEDHTGSIMRLTGIEAVQNADEPILTEDDFLNDNRIFFKRNNVSFQHDYCKAIIIKAPRYYGAGKHCNDESIKIEPDIFLVNLSKIDSEYAKLLADQNLQLYDNLYLTRDKVDAHLDNIKNVSNVPCPPDLQSLLLEIE